MDKRTLLAVGLSMIVMVGYFFIQEKFFPAREPVQQQENVATAESTAPAVSLPDNQVIISSDTQAETEEIQFTVAPSFSAEYIPPEIVTIETALLSVKLTNAGGEIISYQLKNHLDKTEPVEMILTGDSNSQAFAVAFGSMDDVISKKVRPVDRNFRVKIISDLIVEFSQDFSTSSGTYFTLYKRYEFKPDEYMFELTIALNGGNSTNSFNFQGAAYTLFFGPQIGPKFAKLDQRYEYRNYLTYKGKLKKEKVNDKEPTVITSNPAWAAIEGKYFTLIAMPYTNQYELAFSTRAEDGIPNASRLYISRPAFGSSRLEDKYHFYLGPKNLDDSSKGETPLIAYERGDNGFRLRETGLVEVAATKGFLAPLEKVLKWFLLLFHKIIPNYGVAIILLTLLVKVIMFPLTKKGSESTMRMQALAPRIKELQEKYKDNRQKLNAEMSEFYKKEGYNPISGCLPMLLQLPIFFAMYNLFNNHFDLRGAMFIPIWIPDLSLPESIFNFPNNFRLPLLGWSAIRLLPFIYVGSQLLYGKVTQTPDQQGNPQMKMMLYAMPVVFFFVLYDVPSGLLLYWIMSNLLTMVQQLSINKYIARKKAAAAATTSANVAAEAPPKPKPVIAPGSGTSGSKIKKKKKKK